MAVPRIYYFWQSLKELAYVDSVFQTSGRGGAEMGADAATQKVSQPEPKPTSDVKPSNSTRGRSKRGCDGIGNSYTTAREAPCQWGWRLAEFTRIMIKVLP